MSPLSQISKTTENSVIYIQKHCGPAKNSTLTLQKASKTPQKTGILLGKPSDLIQPKQKLTNYQSLTDPLRTPNKSQMNLTNFLQLQAKYR